ncbi:MAG: arginine--tRNA ligase [Lachnospiraceae bacterium]
MKKMLELIAEEVGQAFEKAGYDKEYARVTVSNRPDLCEYQCNGAMAGAKVYKKAPIMIANEVVAYLLDSKKIASAEAAAPGFINMKLRPEYIATYLNDMKVAKDLGIEKAMNPKTIVVDYGGANVAKPLHVGHLRSAIIGESLKKIARFLGHEVIGDVHLGDWGYQMGLVITELQKRQPQLPYFEENYQGDYPKEPPFTIHELEEIYPTASTRAKEDEEYKEEALRATYLLQNGHRGYTAIWNHIMNVSVADLKKNYGNLDVTFDLWKGEADAQKYIPAMVEHLKEGGYAHLDDGALVVDVKEDSDTKEIPPCMILKSDGAALYDTTDLATLVEREELYHPDEVLYVVDKRQELHFTQVFRCARKTNIVKPNTKLTFLGFGTMNGKDGKPFKTREGGVMRLEDLIREINEQMYEKIADNRMMSQEEAKETARMIGLSALKYGDLSNQASKDYMFDLERFMSFEGNTGPYILYTIVRIKSILAKYMETNKSMEECMLRGAVTESQRSLMLEVVKFNEIIEIAHEECAPHKICAYIYEVANAFNKFYHETKILAEENEDTKESFIALLILTKKLLETCIDLLGFEAPERM